MTGTAFSPDFFPAEFGAATTATMTTWHTVESARDQWPDAPSDFGDSGDDTLLELLAVARDAVIAYGPILADPDVIPNGYRAAQLKAARNAWTTQHVSQDGFVDGGQFGLESQFLPWHQDVRPKTGKPWIG